MRYVKHVIISVNIMLEIHFIFVAKCEVSSMFHTFKLHYISLFVIDISELMNIFIPLPFCDRRHYVVGPSVCEFICPSCLFMPFELCSGGIIINTVLVDF